MFLFLMQMLKAVFQITWTSEGFKDTHICVNGVCECRFADFGTSHKDIPRWMCPLDIKEQVNINKGMEEKNVGT